MTKHRTYVLPDGTHVLDRPKVKRGTAPRRGLDSELARMKRSVARAEPSTPAATRRETKKAAAKVLVMRAAMRGTVTGRLPAGATEHMAPEEHPVYALEQRVNFILRSKAKGVNGNVPHSVRVRVVERSDGQQVLEVLSRNGVIVIAPKMGNVIEVESRW